MRVLWPGLVCASVLFAGASASAAASQDTASASGRPSHPVPPAKPAAHQARPQVKPATTAADRPQQVAQAAPRPSAAPGAQAAPRPQAAPAPQATPAAPSAAPAPAGERPRQPSLLSADEIISDDEKNLVTAVGHVEIATESRTVYADKVTYDRATKVVTATGNVRLFEASGEIIFADYAELTDDFVNVFADKVRVLMPDSSRMVGTEGERTAGTFMRMNRGVYTPCSLCADDPDAAPLWQIRARKAVHDKEDKQVRYQDVTMEMFGVPFFYTPYFDHPDPTVDRKSGFLAPIFGQSSNLGAAFRTSYYFDLQPETDATLHLSFFGSENPLLGGEVRHRFEDGSLIVDGSVTRSRYTQRTGSVEPQKFRGHLFGDLLYELSDAWRVGGQLRVASDYNFLREYFRVTGENFLTSRGYGEGFYGRDYAVVNAYRFQSLLKDDDGTLPVVFPDAAYHALGEPGKFLGGRWSFDAGLRGMTRDEGSDSTRFTVEPGWRWDYIEPFSGVVASFETSVRTDIYAFRDWDRSDVAGKQSLDGTEARIYPEAQFTVSYPWVSHNDWFETLIEPIAAFTSAPKTSFNPDFPIEDSLDLEFTDLSLFSRNRFVGTDRLEGGQRLAYGMRLGVYDYGDARAEVFLGQSLQLVGRDRFSEGSGLHETRSDYVGHIDLQYASWLQAFYGFRLDQDGLTPRFQFANVSAGIPALRGGISYTSVDEVSGLEQAGVRREFATLSASSAISRYWSVGLAHSQAIFPDPGPRALSATLNYVDECLIFQSVATRDYTVVPGVDSGLTVLFRLVFRNLGEITSPSLSPDLLGGKTTSSRSY